MNASVSDAAARIVAMDLEMKARHRLRRQAKLVVAGENYGWRVMLGPWTFWVPPGSSASVPVCARLERWVPTGIPLET